MVVIGGISETDIGSDYFLRAERWYNDETAMVQRWHSDGITMPQRWPGGMGFVRFSREKATLEVTVFFCLFS